MVDKTSVKCARTFIEMEAKMGASRPSRALPGPAAAATAADAVATVTVTAAAKRPRHSNTVHHR